MKPKILYYNIQSFQQNSIEYLNMFFDVIVLENPDFDQETILKEIDALFAPMGFVFDRKKIDLCKKLSVIATPTTGEYHIDVNYAKSKGVSICSLKKHKQFLQTITATAELTWGLIISITRKLLQAEKSVKNFEWNGISFGKQTPKMLSEMSLGIIGLGRLGRIVANYGKAFNMNVFYYDPYVNNENFNRCEQLIDLAKVSDIVSLHVHLNEETKYLIDSNFINQMPKKSYIINTSRGGIINENDMLTALKNGHLAGVALDMLENEHLPDFNLNQNSIVQYARHNDNIIITPKIGGATVDSWEKTEKFIIDLIFDELKKK